MFCFYPDLPNRWIILIVTHFKRSVLAISHQLQVASMIDPVTAFLKRANINLPAPISSCIVISTETPLSETTDKSGEISGKVLQHHNIPDPVSTASRVLNTLSCCSDLLASIDDADSNIKLLRIQSDLSQSLIITGKRVQWIQNQNGFRLLILLFRQSVCAFCYIE